MTIGVVPGADVRVRRAQVPVEQRDGKARGSIIDVDIRQTAVERDRDLNRRRASLLAVVERIAFMKHGVVGHALELARALEPRARVRRQSGVHPELAIAGGLRDLAPDRINVLDERQGVTDRRTRRVGHRRCHQRMGDGVEGGLRGEAEDLVVERPNVQRLAGRLRESRHPVAHQMLAALVESRIGAAETHGGLLSERDRGPEHGEKAKADHYTRAARPGSLNHRELLCWGSGF